MKVLLTGYTGFLGRHVARALKQHGHWVRVILHQRTVARMDFNIEADDLIWGSLENPLIMKRALDGIEAVIHSAWRFNPQTAERPTVNETLAKLFFEESVQAGVQSFAFLSSVAVYGMAADKGKAIDETSAYASGGFIYPSEKIATEKVLQIIEHRTMKLGIFRPGPIFDDKRSPVKKRIGKIAIGIGTGRNPMPFIHAADVAEAIMLWLNNGKDGDVYNITPSKCLKLHEWYAAWGSKHGLKLTPLFIPIWFLKCAAWGATGLKKVMGKAGKVDIKYALATATRSLEYSNVNLIRDLSWQPLHTNGMVEGIKPLTKLIKKEES